MLQNEPLVAKIGVDTAENEPIFGWIQLVQLSRFNSSILSLLEPREQRTRRRKRRRRSLHHAGRVELLRRRRAAEMRRPEASQIRHLRDLRPQQPQHTRGLDHAEIRIAVQRAGPQRPQQRVVEPVEPKDRIELFEY